MELWKDIPDFEGLYQVSNTGKVRSLNYHLKGVCQELQQDLNKGYLRVTLSKNNRPLRVQVHVLVAFLFVSGYAPWKEVNHDDFDRTNNNDWNLSWMTRSQNESYTHKHGRKKPPCIKPVINVESGIFYDSISEAANVHGIKMRTLSAMLNGQNPNKTYLKIA